MLKEVLEVAASVIILSAPVHLMWTASQELRLQRMEARPKDVLVRVVSGETTSFKPTHSSLFPTIQQDADQRNP